LTNTGTTCRGQGRLMQARMMRNNNPHQPKHGTDRLLIQRG
jgi:hypothetical protein